MELLVLRRAGRRPFRTDRRSGVEPERSRGRPDQHRDDHADAVRNEDARREDHRRNAGCARCVGHLQHRRPLRLRHVLHAHREPRRGDGADVRHAVQPDIPAGRAGQVEEPAAEPAAAAALYPRLPLAADTRPMYPGAIADRSWRQPPRECAADTRHARRALLSESTVPRAGGSRSSATSGRVEITPKLEALLADWKGAGSKAPELALPPPAKAAGHPRGPAEIGARPSTSATMRSIAAAPTTSRPRC